MTPDRYVGVDLYWRINCYGGIITLHINNIPMVPNPLTPPPLALQLRSLPPLVDLS